MGVSRSIGVNITPPSPYLYTGVPLSYKKKYDNGTTEGGAGTEGNRGAMVTPIPHHIRICTQQDTPSILPDTGGLLFYSHITTGYCGHVSLRDVKMPGNGPIRVYGRFFCRDGTNIPARPENAPYARFTPAPGMPPGPQPAPDVAGQQKTPGSARG